MALLVAFAGACATGPTPAARPAATQPRPAPAIAAITDYDQIESEVLAALNWARTSPRAVATSLDQVAGYYNGLLFKRPTWSFALRTQEGVAPVHEAANALRAKPAVGAVTLSEALSRAARDHIADQGRTGKVGHTGSDGSSTSSRAARYGSWQVTINENIEYGSERTGREVIEGLIIDDGVADRGHRTNIYEPRSKVVGVACGPHPTYRSMCVIIQAGGFVAK